MTATVPIRAGEIVGMNARIVKSSCESLQSLTGVVALETRNTIYLRTARGLKQISKASAHEIELSSEAGACFISGSSLTGRPEDRLAYSG